MRNRQQTRDSSAIGEAGPGRAFFAPSLRANATRRCWQLESPRHSCHAGPDCASLEGAWQPEIEGRLRRRWIVDVGVDVLDARVRQHDRSRRGRASHPDWPQAARSHWSPAYPRVSDPPRQDPSRDVVDHRVQVAAVPSSNRMTVVSMCHISSARVVRRPTFGCAGCTRSRGRRRPNFCTRCYQVDGEAQTVPSRCARTASVLVGTCRYSSAGHHILDCPNLGWGQSMRRRVRTGRLVVKRTRVLPPSPGVEPTRRQTQEPKDRAQRETLVRSLHGAEDPAAWRVRQAGARRRA